MYFVQQLRTIKECQDFVPLVPIFMFLSMHLKRHLTRNKTVFLVNTFLLSPRLEYQGKLTYLHDMTIFIVECQCSTRMVISKQIHAPSEAFPGMGINQLASL
jgi:hypothetical protein